MQPCVRAFLQWKNIGSEFQRENVTQQQQKIYQSLKHTNTPVLSSYKSTLVTLLLNYQSDFNHTKQIQKKLIKITFAYCSITDCALSPFSFLQIIVPKKRAAILIDRLMVALKKAIEEEAEAGQGVSDGSAKTTYTLRPEDAVRTVHTLFLLLLRMRKTSVLYVTCERMARFYA